MTRASILHERIKLSNRIDSIYISGAVGLGMNCDFCGKLVTRYKSFYSPSGMDPTELHVCVDCIKKWLFDLDQLPMSGTHAV
jgi:hypothetical protein